jgi:serine/threonine-protein kinase RIM15
LSPSDVNIFKDASQRLQEDDSHTIEVRFKLYVEPTTEHDPSAGTLYQLMEGKGMLIIDREDGQPSHTMWVIKPMALARFEDDTPIVVIPENDLAPEPASTIRSSLVDQSDFEPVTPFPFSQPISKKPILCRICECQIPQWYFEKHSDTCAETHIFEAGIVECHESISELRNTIHELYVAVDRPSPIVIPEYRGMHIFSPSSSPIVSSPLQLFRANKMQRLGIKKMQRRLLDQIDEILQVSLEISMPSLKEEGQ